MSKVSHRVIKNTGWQKNVRRVTQIRKNANTVMGFTLPGFTKNVRNAEHLFHFKTSRELISRIFSLIQFLKIKKLPARTKLPTPTAKMVLQAKKIFITTDYRERKKCHIHQAAEATQEDTTQVHIIQVHTAITTPEDTLLPATDRPSKNLQVILKAQKNTFTM